MNQKSNSGTSEVTVRRSAETLHLKYGDLASEYASVRAETAEIAGEESDAVHWQKVEQSLEEQDQ